MSAPEPSLGCADNHSSNATCGFEPRARAGWTAWSSAAQQKPPGGASLREREGHMQLAGFAGRWSHSSLYCICNPDAVPQSLRLRAYRLTNNTAAEEPILNLTCWGVSYNAPLELPATNHKGGKGIRRHAEPSALLEFKKNLLQFMQHLTLHCIPMLHKISPPSLSWYPSSIEETAKLSQEHLMSGS